MRRVTNDEKLATIASHIWAEEESSTEWKDEGKRVVPLLPRLAPQTAFYPIANAAATNQFKKNKLMPPPSETWNRKRQVLNQMAPTETKRFRGDPNNPNIVITRKSFPSSPKTKTHPHQPQNVTPLVSRVGKVTALRTIRSPQPYVTTPRPEAQGTPRVIFVSASSTMAHQSSTLQTSQTSTPVTSSTFTRQIRTIIKQPGSLTPQTITIPRLQKGLTSSQVIMVPSNVAGKPSLVPLSSLRAVRSASPLHITVPAQARTSLLRQPNLIIVPNSATGTTGLTLQTIKTQTPGLKVSPAPKIITMRQTPLEFKVSTGDSFKSALPASTSISSLTKGVSTTVSAPQTITIQSVKESRPGGNVIEIQASGDALQRLVSKGKLTQDIIQLVQKAVSMAGQKTQTQTSPGATTATVGNQAQSSAETVAPSTSQQSEACETDDVEIIEEINRKDEAVDQPPTIIQ